ncbi:exocyst complex component 7-like isoform X2 [Engraulis encrasicolus]|uniref:exocyst complex component 7-like isoform X2 n=1 Tax=Engraulis encrasicolus TaxID=184585 RepID=UPI002FD29960
MSKKKKTMSRLEEIDSCLEKDRQLQSFVKDAIEKNDQFSSLMDSMFNRLSTRLDRLQNAIEKFGEMKRLKTVKRNAEDTVAELNTVIGYYHVLSITNSTTKEGPKGQLEDYLRCLEKIKAAADYFDEVLPYGLELRAMKLKLYACRQQLKSEFNRLLLRCSNPASPLDVLCLIEQEKLDGYHRYSTSKPCVGVPSAERHDMASISPWLCEEPSKLDILLEDVDKVCFRAPKKSDKPLKTMSLDRDVCGSPHPQKKRAAFWLGRKRFKTRSLDRPPALMSLPQRKEGGDFQSSVLPTIMEEETPLETRSRSPNRLKTRSLDGTETPNTFKAPLPGSPFVRKTASWLNNKMQSRQTRSLERHPGLPPVHSPAVRGKPQLPFNIFSAYSSARSCRLNRSFQDFKDHLHKSSTSLRSFSLPISSPSRSSSSSYSSSSSSSFTRSSLSNSISRAFKMLGKEGWGDIDVEHYSQSIKAFRLLAAAEVDAVGEIFPKTHWGKVVDPLVQKALDALIDDGEYIIYVARHAVHRCHHYGMLLTVLRVLQDLKEGQHSIHCLLMYASDETQEKLPSLAKSMEAFVLQGLDRYRDSIKEKTYKKREMPPDGTVHELACNVVLFLSQLVQMNATLGVFHLRDAATSMGSMGYSVGVNGNRHLRLFISDVLELVFLSLESMADEYGDSALKAIFLLNNANYIYNCILKAQLQEVWAACKESPLAVWEGRVEEQKKKYVQSWMKVTEYLWCDEGVPLAEPGSRDFNDGIDGLVARQERWTVPDQVLRETLQQELLCVVGQAYRTFLWRYNKVKFTRYPQKYFKYSTEEVEEKIERLFQSLT